MGQFQGSLFCSIGLAPVPALLLLQSKPFYHQSHSPTSFFLFKIVVAILRPAPFHVNFRISLSISIKIFAGILVGISLDPTVYLGNNPPILSSQTLTWDHKWGYNRKPHLYGQKYGDILILGVPCT